MLYGIRQAHTLGDGEQGTCVFMSCASVHGYASNVKHSCASKMFCCRLEKKMCRLHVWAAATEKEEDVDIEEDAVSDLPPYIILAVCCQASPQGICEVDYRSMATLSLQTLGHHCCLCMQMNRMEKSLESTQGAFATVRTGRANTGMLDRIMVRQTT